MNEFTPKGYKEEEIDPEEVVRPRLERRERLIWVGQPIAKRAMMGGFILYPFALIWTAFAIFWVVKAYESVSNGVSAGMIELLFPLFGVPFVLAGLGMFAVPFIAYRKAKTIFYALTDRRCFMLETGGKKVFRNYPFSDWQGTISLKKRKDGSGSVFFAKRLERTGKGRKRWQKKGFECVENAERVERKLRDALSNYNEKKEAGLV